MYRREGYSRVVYSIDVDDAAFSFGAIDGFRTSLDVEKREKAWIYRAFSAVNATGLDISGSVRMG